MMGISKHTAAPPSVHQRDQPLERPQTSGLRPFRVCALDSPRVSRKEDHHHRPLPLFSLPSLTHSLTISPPVAPHRDYHIRPSIPATPKHKRTCILPALPASHLPNSQPAFTCCKPAPTLKVVATIYYTSIPLSHTYKTPRRQHGSHHCCSRLAPRGVQEAERYVPIANNMHCRREPTHSHPTSQASSRTRTPSSRPLPTLASRLRVSALRTAPSRICQALP